MDGGRVDVEGSGDFANRPAFLDQCHGQGPLIRMNRPGFPAKFASGRRWVREAELIEERWSHCPIFSR